MGEGVPNQACEPEGALHDYEPRARISLDLWWEGSNGSSPPWVSSLLALSHAHRPHPHTVGNLALG